MEPKPERTPLTPQLVQKQQPGATPIEISDGRTGLIFTTLPSGKKQWAVRYRFRGKRRRHVLAEYPGISLAKARDLARAALVRVRNGEDPAGERTAAKARPVDTVSALAAEYMLRHARPKKRSADEDERLLNVEVLPRWRDHVVRDLTRRDVRTLVERIVDRGSPVQANRVLSLVRKMLNFGVDREWLDANPAARLAKPTKEVSRDRVLTDDELRSLWTCLSRFPTTEQRQAPGRKRQHATDEGPLCPISRPLAAAQKVRLLTAQRGGEVTNMRWQDLDLETGWWTIPETMTKNGELHRVPLTLDVIALIQDQVEDETLPTEGLVFVGVGESLRDRAKKASKVLTKVLGFEFRTHDLRRTAATGMAAAGVPSEHIGKVLNHVDRGARATQVYDRHTYDNEKRAALEAWSRRLTAILTAAPATNKVVPITAKRSRS